MPYLTRVKAYTQHLIAVTGWQKWCPFHTHFKTLHIVIYAYIRLPGDNKNNSGTESKLHTWREYSTLQAQQERVKSQQTHYFKASECSIFTAIFSTLIQTVSSEVQ